MFSAPRFIVHDFAVESKPMHPSAEQAEMVEEEVAAVNNINLFSMLKKTNYVLSEQDLSHDEFNLVSKIFAAIGRTNISVEGPNSEVSLALMSALAQSPKRDLTEHTNLTRVLDPEFKIVIHFSKQCTETSSKLHKGEGTLIWIQTYSLEQIASQPNLKSEFWNFLKELRNTEQL